MGVDHLGLERLLNFARDSASDKIPATPSSLGDSLVETALTLILEQVVPRFLGWSAAASRNLYIFALKENSHGY